jgi:uncharacterized repeat protein (TIGR03803 family)
MNSKTILFVTVSLAAYGQTPVTLVNFDVTNGVQPYFGSPVQAANGDLYGTTYEGGATAGPDGLVGDGTIFKMTPEGVLTTVHSFEGTDGSLSAGALVQATNGDLYGTTVEGGASGDGTISK